MRPLSLDLDQLEVATASHVYAVGDIHGRLDLLLEIEMMIARDIAEISAADPLICYLGDYIDKGPQSADVIEYLSRRQNTPNLRRVFLMGNHEDRMLKFFDDPQAHGARWMDFGGLDALLSYGVADQQMVKTDNWLGLHAALLALVPASHLKFLATLTIAMRWQNFLFVHAGLNPDKPITHQDPHDLMWIREPFLQSARDWGFRVVHGHVPVDAPLFTSNRIDLDTAAYRSGILTCLVLDGVEQRLLQTSP